MKKILVWAMLTCSCFPLSAGFIEGEDAFGNKRYSEAMQNFRPLADEGDYRAQYYVAYMYLNGYGVTKNNQLGLQYLEKSLSSGYADAQALMGFLYSQGQVVPMDRKKAVSLYQKAADNGNVAALLNLGIAYYQGDGVPRNLLKAIELLEKIPVEQQPAAKRYLGDIYLAQDTENTDKAIAAYRSAAAAGDLASYVSLADIYLQGKNVDRDLERGLNYYNYAASHNFAPAQYALGIMYANGESVTRDPVLAHAWLSWAVNQNYEPAREALNQIKSEMTLTDLDKARQKFIDIQNHTLGKAASPFEEEARIQSTANNTTKLFRRPRR